MNLDRPANSLQLSRRSLGVLSMASLAGVTCERTPKVKPRDTFERDLLASYRQQVVGLDLEDVHAVLRAQGTPILRIETASNPAGIDVAIQSVLSVVDPSRTRVLVLLAFSPGSSWFEAFTQTVRATRLHTQDDSTLIFGACRDEALGSGAVRVSLLNA